MTTRRFDKVILSAVEAGLVDQIHFKVRLWLKEKYGSEKPPLKKHDDALVVPMKITDFLGLLMVRAGDERGGGAEFYHAEYHVQSDSVNQGDGSLEIFLNRPSPTVFQNWRQSHIFSSYPVPLFSVLRPLLRAVRVGLRRRALHQIREKSIG